MRPQIIRLGILGALLLVLCALLSNTGRRARENAHYSTMPASKPGRVAAPNAARTSEQIGTPFNYGVRYVDADREPASFGAGSANDAMVPSARTPHGLRAAPAAGKPSPLLGSPAAAADLPIQDAHRKVIMTANITLEAKDFEKVHSAIQEVARNMGGYVGGSQLNLPGEGQQSGTITIRVPQYRYADALKAIKQYGKTLAEEQSAEDVTQKHVDLDARVRNLKAHELRTLEILRRARTVQETLTVDERLTEVRGEIESLEGELRYLRFQVAMATIHVTLAAKAVAAPPAPPPAAAGWTWGSEFRGAWDVVRGVGRSLAALIAWVLVLALIWGPLAVIAVVLYRKYGHSLKALAPEQEAEARELVEQVG